MSKLAEIRMERMRERSRYTKANLARVAGVSRPTYDKIEAGLSPAPPGAPERLASYLGCEVSDIFLPREVSETYFTK